VPANYFASATSPEAQARAFTAAESLLDALS
jgi:hypothetical protein